MKKQIYAFAAAAFLMIPALAFAATSQSTLTHTESLIRQVGSLVQTATVIVAALALLAFFWGLTKFILAGADIEKKLEGKNLMIWGTVALFVMVSVWGLVRLLQSELLPGGTNFGNVEVPKFNGVF